MAPYTGEIPMVEEPKQSLLSSLDTSTPSGVAYLVAAGAGVAAVLCLLLALFGLMPWAWFVILPYWVVWPGGGSFWSGQCPASAS